MITELGKLLRKLRIDRGEVLKNMADKLNISSAYLSAVEVGKRNIPDHWANEIIRLYDLMGEEAEKLKTLADSSQKSIKVDLEGSNQAKRQVALIFARSFDEMDIDTAKKLIQLLQKEKIGA